MAVNAEIIIASVDDAVLIPSSSNQTKNGESTVRVLRNKVVETVTVVTGLSSDTQTAITSGINEGDLVITSTTTGTTKSSTNSSGSVFGNTSGGMRMSL
jgi:macrolide-specific efflux system membrane fusion protein